MKLFEKKLGSYYELVMNQDKEGNIDIELFKKWSKYDGFEGTDNILHFDKAERERALCIYNSINLKTLAKYFNWKVTK